jgi:hypothetical protein
MTVYLEILPDFLVSFKPVKQTGVLYSFALRSSFKEEDCDILSCDIFVLTAAMNLLR